MKTILDVINLGEEYLQKKGIERARREAEELIADVLGISRISLYLDFEKPLSEKELEKCREFFKRRGQREPPQYISGSVIFGNVCIKVNSDVLIPRPETEQLVNLIIRDLEAQSLNGDLQGKILWDMCTGSGCIGISIKKRFPQLKVILSDISEKALRVAEENAKANGVDVELKLGNMFEIVDQPIDFFVSNPPYVTESEYQVLAPEIKYEPSNAFLAGKDGLIFYQIIAEQLPKYLQKMAWLEIGSAQGVVLQTLFQNYFKHCSLEKDWSGKDRFIKLS